MGMVLMGPIPVQHWYQLQFVTTKVKSALRLPVDMNSAVVLEAEILHMYAVKLISFETSPEVVICQFSCVMFACEESNSKSGLVCHRDHMWQQCGESFHWACGNLFSQLAGIKL